MEAYNLNYVDDDVWDFIEYEGGAWWYYLPELDHQILYEYNGFLTEC